jgi:flagellar hook-associated protein 3 FlgL
VSGISDLSQTFPGGFQGSAIANAATVARRLNTLTQQAGDGLIADTYAGLTSGIHAALVMGPAIAREQGWQTDVSAATGRMQVAQTALKQISSIASQFYAQTNNLNGLNASEIDSNAASARDALGQVADLLNTTDGGVYVFAGQDTSNAPIPNPSRILTSGYFQQIQQSVSGLSAAGSVATVQATLAAAQSDAAGTSPFSTYLSQSATASRSVLIAESGELLPTGMLANSNANVASVGATTTGSYIRDILRGLATLGALSSAQVGVAGFADVVADARTGLGGAIGALNQDAGVLGDRQTALMSAVQESASTVTALQSQLSAAQDVDMAATLSQLSQTQTQLRASYQMIADSQSLSLVKYLSSTG